MCECVASDVCPGDAHARLEPAANDMSLNPQPVGGTHSLFNNSLRRVTTQANHDSQPSRSATNLRKHSKPLTLVTKDAHVKASN